MFRERMRPLSQIPAIQGAHHLKGQLINQQHICLLDEPGGRSIKGTVDPARQAIVQCEIGRMELSLASHGMVWEKWLLERTVVSVLSDGLHPRNTDRRRTATALPRVAPRRPIQDLEFNWSGIQYSGST